MADIQQTPIVTQQPLPKKPLMKRLLPILLILGGLMVVYMIFAFYLLATAEEGKQLSIAGDSTPGFLNGIVVGVYIEFLIFAFVAFVLVMIPLFKMLLAKKEDVLGKKSAKKKVIISSVVLFILLAGWLTSFIYLESRRDVLKINVVRAPIETEPVDTLRLKAPVTIKFDATYANVDPKNFRVVLYNWDFGDGETEIGDRVVSHDYTKKGSYTVKLTIEKQNILTGEEAKDIHTKEVSITDQSLTASFEATPQSGESPLEVEFDGSKSTDPDGKIGKYEWDLDGDGTFEEDYEDQVTFKYKYEKIGTYEVVLRVTSFGTTDYAIDKKQIVVSQGETPAVVIEVEGNPEKFEKGVSYIFKGGESTSPNGKIISYEWDFDDGTTLETTKTITHTFTREGVFNVTLKVKDEKDKEGESVKEVVIGTKPGTPQAIMETNPILKEGELALEGAVPFKVSFDSSKSSDPDNNIVDYEWDFDSNGKADAYGKKVDFTFEKVGTTKVTLTVADADGNKSTATVGIKTLEQGIKAEIKASPVEGEVPLTVSFDATGSFNPNGTISSYKWDFGDGTNPLLGPGKINHKYTTIGQYTVSVTAIGNDNATDSAETYVVVRSVQMNSCFRASVESGKAPLTVIFDPACSTGTITNYSWKFGDGGVANEVKPSHLFEKPGLYNVELEVTDKDQNVSTYSSTIKVEQ